MNARALIAVAAVLAVVALLGFGLSSKGGSAIAIGQQAPDGSLQRLGSSGTARISDYRGHWTLVNFWASWCQPCRSEAPLLERFYRQHSGQGAIVLGVDLDDNTNDATTFIHRYGLTYPQLRSPDGSRWRDDYGMTGFPESFLIDPRGHLAVIRRGPVDQAILTSEFEPAINGHPASATGS